MAATRTSWLSPTPWQWRAVATPRCIPFFFPPHPYPYLSFLYPRHELFLYNHLFHTTVYHGLKCDRRASVSLMQRKKSAYKNESIDVFGVRLHWTHCGVMFHMRRGGFCTRVPIEKKTAPQQKLNFLLDTYRYIRFVSNFDNKAYFLSSVFSFVRLAAK